MLTLTPEVEAILGFFSGMFAQQRSSQHAQMLLIGALLCHGKRTISRVLQVMGLAEESHYINYHRMLSRVRWSGQAGQNNYWNWCRLDCWESLP